MKRTDILDAWVFLRKKNHDISDDALDFIKESSLKAFDESLEVKCDHQPVINVMPDCNDICKCRRCGCDIKWVVAGNYLAVKTRN